MILWFYDYAYNQFFFKKLGTALYNLHYVFHNLNDYVLVNGMSFEKMANSPPPPVYTFWEFTLSWHQWLKQLFLLNSCFSPTEPTQQWENKPQSLLVIIWRVN